MTRLRVFLILLLAAVVAPGARAAFIDVDLAGVLASTSSGDEVAIIIRFDDSLDLQHLQRDLSKQLKELYPDPQERRIVRRAVKRSLLIQSLHRRSAAASQPVQQLLAARGIGVSRSLWAINALAVTVPADMVEEISQFPGVVSISSDAVVQGPGPGTAPTAPSYWNLDATGVSGLWNIGHTGTGVVVATMDTGADVSHPDLGPGFRGGDNSWFDAYGQYSSPADPLGHGTRVLGLIVGGQSGGYQIGMAPDAQWIAAKIFNNANQATLSAIHAGLQWALDPDGDPQSDDAPDIVNNSWDLAATIGDCNQEFAADIALLRTAEIAVTFSGGNFGPKSDTSVSPANDPASMSVGSVDNRNRIARSSSRGPNACDGGIYPKLVAPGESVLTSDVMPNTYTVVSGTSFSVAHVSGALAVLKGAFPDATTTELENALTSTAGDLGDAGADNTFGHGMLDVAAAYDSLDSGGAPDAGSLEFSMANYSVDENVATISITVKRTGGAAGDVAVDYSTSDGSAIAGDDYSATAGTLNLLDGETSGSFIVPILDDADYEGDEQFSLGLSNPAGGAALGAQGTANVTIADDESPPAPADNDGDGFGEDVDCNDNNANVYPGAAEIKHDGIDQDCNGYDLTIDITRATYSGNQAVVWATSDLGSQAGLNVTFQLANGGSFTTSMAWKSRNGRWENSVKRFTKSHGSEPVAVTVNGIEGSESAPVQ